MDWIFIPETIKLLEESLGGKLFDIGLDDFFFNLKSKIIATKVKRNVGLQHTKKLLHSKGNHQQNEKPACWLGENICKSYNWQYNTTVNNKQAI